MKHLSKLAFLAAAAAIFPAVSQAENSILSSLKMQGVNAIVMDDQHLSEVKGAARITGQPLPSVTVGLQEYHVTWNKVGSQSDYRSYLPSGSSYDPSAKRTFTEAGVVYSVAGDLWLADKISKPGSWSSVNSSTVDSHLQALDSTGAPLDFGWRTTSWNRPISTFRW